MELSEEDKRILNEAADSAVAALAVYGLKVIMQLPHTLLCSVMMAKGWEQRTIRQPDGTRTKVWIEPPRDPRACPHCDQIHDEDHKHEGLN